MDSQYSEVLAFQVIYIQLWIVLDKLLHLSHGTFQISL